MAILIKDESIVFPEGCFPMESKRICPFWKICRVDKNQIGRIFINERPDDCPLVDVQMCSHEHWIPCHKQWETKNEFTCSGCGQHVNYKSDYCPNCGSIMWELE